MTVAWKRPKSESCTLVLDSERSMSAWTILLSRTISASRAGTSGRPCFLRRSGIAGLRGAGPEGHAGQGLIDVHPAELLPVGVEAHRVVPSQYVVHGRAEASLGDLQLAQNTVAGEDEFRLADFGTDPRQGLLEVGDQVHPRGLAEDHPTLDRAVEGQAAVWVGLLDGPYVVGAVDEDDDRRGREMDRREVV